MTDRSDRAADLLDAVCRHVPDVLAAAAAPPRLLRLRVGEVSIELEWPEASAGAPVTPAPAPTAPAGAPGPDGGAPGGAGGAPGGAGGTAGSEAGTPVLAPVVGAFYQAPSPGAAPFVAVGDIVRAGDQVGIVEAMKTMIPVEAPAAGRVAEVLVADGEPVEYGQALLRLEPVEVASSGNGAGPPVRRPLRTVLVANRGEIALRVARTCREMGLRVVAVHSTEDADSAVVRFADEAVQIGPAPASRSYLNMPAVIEAGLQRGADAVHPGYGFLSEDADFAEACLANGMAFVGPPPEVLAQLGDKRAARRVMEQAGLPLLPGSRGSLDDLPSAVRLADEIGYPVIVKATAGGGGRGMRVAHERSALPAAYAEARSDAQVLFGRSDVYVERYLAEARHVEVQVLCDEHGLAVHLGERDCSVQRRHQKLVEEAPAPGLSRPVASAMAEAALTGPRAVGYRGAGTFEFLVDDQERFYFMEVNGRIQVEHPVTEMVTGVDLVREQLRVAAGQPLSVTQADVAPRGVAIECRVNAEDPERGFVPTPGVLEECSFPGGPFVRVDTHAGPGSRVPAAYDSLVAKVVAWAPDRPQALARMARALDEVRVGGPGVRTTTGLLAGVVRHPRFVGGTHTTALLAEALDGGRDGAAGAVERPVVTPGRPE